MNSTSDKTNDLLEQQLFELIYGLLEADEAHALRRRVTSEPDVARAYARVVQQSERIALAAQWEEPPLPLAAMLEKQGRFQDDETPSLAPKPALAAPPVPLEFKTTAPAPVASTAAAPSPPTPSPPAGNTPAGDSRALRWAAALAGGLIAAAVMVVACVLLPLRGGSGSAAMNDLKLLTLVLPSNLAPQQSTVIVANVLSSTGEPADYEEVEYAFYDAAGGTLQKGAVATDASGRAAVNFTLPEDADGSVLFFARVAESPPVEAALGVERYREAAASAWVESDRRDYAQNETVRVRVLGEGGKDLPRDMQVVAQDQRGMTTVASGEVKDGIGEYELQLSANPVAGEHIVSALTGAGEEIGSERFLVRGVRESDEKDAVPSGGSGQVALEDESNVKESERLAFRLRKSAIEADEPVQVDLVAKVGHKLLVVVKQHGKVVGSRLVESLADEKQDLRGLEVSLPDDVRGPLTVEAYDWALQPPPLVGRYAAVRQAEPTMTTTISPPTTLGDDQLSIDVDVVDHKKEPAPARLGIVATFQADGAEPSAPRPSSASGGFGSPRGIDFAEGDRLSGKVVSRSEVEGVMRDEFELSPVTYSAPRYDALARYGRLFEAGDAPPSLVFDGEADQLIEARSEQKSGEAAPASGPGTVPYEAAVAPWRRSLPSPQVVSNSAAIESLRTVANSPLGEVPPLWWGLGFLGAGGVVVLIGVAVTLARRPDPWVVWLPVGLVAAACVVAAAYHGWPRESNLTLAKGESSLPGSGIERRNLSTDSLADPTVDPSGQVIPLAVVPLFAAGGEPSNEIFAQEQNAPPGPDPATLGDQKQILVRAGDPSAQHPAVLPASLPRPINPATPEPKKTEGKPEGNSDDRPSNRPELTPLEIRPIIKSEPLRVSGARSFGIDTRQKDGYGYAAFDDHAAGEQTVIWEPTAKTDANGRARVLLPRPPGPGFYKLRVTADRNGETVTTERVFQVK